MRVPVIQGIIRRRILVNFRVEPDVAERQLPARFRPKLYAGKAVMGVCLIRLEHLRPKRLPEFLGISSENAAHRIAVLWDDPDGATLEGVFIPRRDTDSELNQLLGGRVFPGEHHRAKFEVKESTNEISLSMRSDDGAVTIELDGKGSDVLPRDSIFSSLAASSAFFESGSLGYSATRDPFRLDGLRLQTKAWRVEPLELGKVYSSYFADEAKFPKGSVEFDHALVMRDVEHEWHSASELRL
jgi:hypothetical protein